MKQILKKYWFIFGLVIIFHLTVVDATGNLSEAGKWLKSHRGPDIVIILIFIISGLMLNAELVKHGLLDLKGILVALVLAFLFTKQAGILPGKRESVIFMGGQKTLPLSIIIQVSAFPQYALALVVCVTHHIVHLMMDGYLAGRLSRKEH